MADGRKFCVGGNWKMNGNKSSIDDIIKFLNEKGLNPNTGSLCTEAIMTCDAISIPVQ